MGAAFSSKAPLVEDTDTKRDISFAQSTDARRSVGGGAEFRYKFWFSSQTYYMMRPIENVHIYLWILKDLSWSQDWYYPALIFGALALLWCGALMYEAYRWRSLYEGYMIIGVTMWLTANYVWMAGEVTHDDDGVVLRPSAILMETTIAWFLFYYLVLKPLGLLKTENSHSERFNAIGLRSRFGYFENWREYEHLHTLLWLSKDLSWNQSCIPTWILFMIPTFLIALDFIWMTWSTKYMFIDCMHYVAQLLWVAGNGIWAMSELFDIPGNDDDKDPYSVWHATHTSSKKLRWWCSVVLVTATVPLILLYTVWLPLTAAEVIKAAEIEENEHVKDKIVCCPRGSCYGCCEAERGEGMKEPLAPQTPSSRA